MSIQYQPNGIAARALAARAASGLPVATIRVDGGTQSRALLQENVIEEYAAAICHGAEFPAIVVFYDGADHWLADGFHRLRAYDQAGFAAVPADVRQGTRRDAILYSVGANETHGLRRTNEDKRRAVLTLLNDAEWADWSDREIARKCNVGHPLVASLRPKVTGSSSSETKRTYTTKHGTKATMNTKAIGKSQPSTETREDATKGPRRGGGGRHGMFIPEGQDVVELCRRGLAMERDGESARDVAVKLNLSTGAYETCRRILLLSDIGTLSARDAEVVSEAMAVLTTGHLGAAIEAVEDLETRVWGDNPNKRIHLLGLHERRVEQFMHSLGVVVQSCMATEEIPLPYLGAEEVKLAASQVGKARGALERFAKRIKEIHE